MARNVTPKQTLAISALLTTGDVSQAAAAAGVTRKTVHKWLNLSAFSDALGDAEKKAFSDATRRLSGLLGRSVEELEKLLLTDNLTVPDRIRTVRTVLDVYPKLREITALEDRITALEEGLKNE